MFTDILYSRNNSEVRNYQSLETRDMWWCLPYVENNNSNIAGLTLSRLSWHKYKGFWHTDVTIRKLESLQILTLLLKHECVLTVINPKLYELFCLEFLFFILLPPEI